MRMDKERKRTKINCSISSGCFFLFMMNNRHEIGIYYQGAINLQ